MDWKYQMDIQILWGNKEKLNEGLFNIKEPHGILCNKQKNSYNVCREKGKIRRAPFGV